MPYEFDIKSNIEEIIKKLRHEDKLLVIENLNITVRVASGGGAVSCEVYHEADREGLR